MRGLTLSQPWATLHVSPCDHTNGQPPKGVESRGWPWPGALEEQPETIAIHAGKGIARESRAAISDGLAFHEPFASLLVGCGFSLLDPWNRGYAKNFEQREPGVWFSKIEKAYRAPLPLGCIVGARRYTACVPGIEIKNRVDRGQLSPLELRLGFYDGSDRWGFVSSWSCRLATPIPCRGYQKLWHVEAVTQLAIERILGQRFSP